MVDHIETQSVAHGVAKAEPLIISETSRTRVVFEPTVHNGGVRGFLKRQNKNASGEWSDANGVDFRNADPDTFVSILLKTDDLRKLYDFLTKLYKVQEHGVEKGTQDYVLAKKDDLIITSSNVAQAIRELIDQNHSKEFWDALVKHQAELALRLAESQIQRERELIINQFRQDLTAYGSDESHWQMFFEKHPWILQSAFALTTFQLQGETFLGGKNTKGRNGQGGVATDFLFKDESTQSFAVVDIKTPKAELTNKTAYRGRRNAGNSNVVYPMHSDLSGGVVQVRTQIAEAIDSFDYLLHKSYPDLNRVHPNGVLVIGTYDSLSEEQKKSFNHFRHGLTGLTVITFDELLRRLEQLYCLDEVNNDSSESNDNWINDLFNGSDPWANATAWPGDSY